MRRLLLIVLLLFGGAGVVTPTVRADPRMHAPVFSWAGYTGSMLPYVQGGENLLILPCPITWVRPGWVILYYRDRQRINVLHRVIELAGDHAHRELIVKGDNNPREDVWPVTRETYIGVLVWMGPTPKGRSP